MEFDHFFHVTITASPGSKLEATSTAEGARRERGGPPDDAALFPPRTQ